MLSNEEFTWLVRAYSTELYRFLYWLCRDRALAEDLVQETFARAWKARGQLRDLDTLKAWLFCIARNEFLRAIERRPPGVESDDAVSSLLVDAIDIERDHAVRDQIARLSPTYREPLLLQVLGGFSCREIAAILEISEEAAMQRVSRARLTLRKAWTASEVVGRECCTRSRGS